MAKNEIAITLKVNDQATAVLNGVEPVSCSATGASFTGLTVINTFAVAHATGSP